MFERKLLIIVGSHLASGMDCQGQNWMVNEESWHCYRFPVSLGNCFLVNVGNWGALCWPEKRILGRWHSAACAAHSAVEGCGSEATLYASH